MAARSRIVVAEELLLGDAPYRGARFAGGPDQEDCGMTDMAVIEGPATRRGGEPNTVSV